MYGRGNYASPYGQGPQRPMPPYQQHPAGPHFQQGHPFPPPLAGLHPSVPTFSSAYPRPPHAPPAISQQGLPIPPLPLGVPGGTPLQRPYMAAQHNYSSGALISHCLPPPPPPPPPSIGAPQVPPPPPTYGQTYGPVQQPPHSSPHMPLPPPPPPTAAGFSRPVNIDSTKQSMTAESQMSSLGPQAPPLPPSSPPMPPPPPSISSPSAKLSPAPRDASLISPIQSGSGPSPSPNKALVSESAADIGTHSQNGDDGPISNKHLSRGLSVPEDLPPPPLKPADEKTVRNIEVLCQFIAKNGSSFEEMARRKEHGNQEFKFLFGGEPGSEAACAHKYYLWMKKKYGLVSSSQEGQVHITSSQGLVDTDPLIQPNSLTIIGTTHSPADSDVDMEDDITQSVKEPAVDLVEDQNPEPILTGDSLKLQNQENVLQYSSDSPDAILSPPANSQAIAEMKPEKSYSQVARIDSPFRLIQNYASDDSSEDDGEPSREEVKVVAVSPPPKSEAISSHDNMDSKSHMTSEARFADTMVTCPEDAFRKNLDDSQTVQRGFQESTTEISFLEKVEVDERVDRDEGSSPSETFQERYAKENHDLSEKQDKNKVPTGLKVDEFGRLVKDGASESESDDAYHSRRHSKRGRSHSRSRSPPDRRRRRSPRKSPRRRNNRRSRSRSWSPKRRRSRSRSPYRLGGDFGGEKSRRDKLQTQECFDFLKGRCFRGASCRYLHHELDRSDTSRRHKSKEDHLAGVSSSRYSDIRGGNNSSRLRQENIEVKGEKMDKHLDKHDGADMPSKVCDENSKDESVDDDVLPDVLQQGVEALSNVQKYQHTGDAHAQVQKVSEVSISHLPTGEEYPTSHTPSTNELPIHHPIAEASSQVHHRIDDDSQDVDGSSRSDPSAVQTSAVSPSGLPVGGHYLGIVSNDTTALSNSTLEFSHQTSHLLTPSMPSQPTSTTQTSLLLVDNKLMAPSVSVLPQSLPVESVPSYQAPLPNQHSHYPVPPNSSWSIPPPPLPRPPYAGDISMSSSPMSFQQGIPPLRNDFPIHTSLRTRPGELPSLSQVGGFQHQTYHMHAQFPSQGTVPFGSFGPGNAPPPPMPFPGDTSVKNLQPFQGSNPLPVEPPKPTFQSQTFAQQMQLPYGPQISAADSMSSYRGGSLPVLGYSSDSLDRDHPTRFLDIGGSRISSHYNPYASTFDKPLTSRFSSAFAQERETAGCKYDSSSAVANTPGEGKNTGDHGPTRAGGQILPRTGGDQYDPLFDSMEPSSESFKKHTRKLGHAADNSDILKLGSSYKVLDVEENNKQKAFGSVAAAISPENDEFGETADAEVGAVENGSPSNSNPDEDEIGAEGDFEIDQINSDGKSKKSKDSRSMKLFKIAVANFVKEVLKPQWRQGNMSKEVFKTIVKKTVEKVSGAMKNRRVPKSQAKIDHYIDSQRRKLTQLVEGYVSKYKI